MGSYMEQTGEYITLDLKYLGTIYSSESLTSMI